MDVISPRASRLCAFAWRRSRLPRAILLLLVGVLIAVPVARAGGDFIDLAVVNGRVWLVGPPGVRSFDARTGRALATPKLTGAPYPLSVTVTGGAAWVASVENGYVWGMLTRIDERSGKAHVIWRRQDSSVQYVAAGTGGVWALIGSQGIAQIALFTLQGRLARTWQIAGAGRMAADRYGCWVSTNQWLLHIDRAGRVRRVVRASLGDVATGARAVWLPRADSVLRIDERTGQVRTLATGPLHLGGFQHDLAVGDNALWALRDAGRAHTIVDRFDLRTGRNTGSVNVPGIADTIVIKANALWIATVIAPTAKPATGYDVIRINPHTLRRTLLLHIT
jgi:hypothetical protein